MYTNAIRSARMLLTITACIAPLLVISAALATTTTLYNGTGSPNGQGFFYIANANGNGSVSATQVGNNLNTTPKTTDSAGFFGTSVPTLDRIAGYTVRFSAQLNAETHAGSDKNSDGVDDRAGFSIIVLSSDKKGIELGFWTDRVWAQNDGINGTPPGTLFTHGEEGAFNTTVSTTYDLVIHGDVYTLKSGTTTILSGPVRDYTAFTGSPNPYTTSNFLFFGDDTSSAAANVTFTGPITITDNAAPTPTPVTPTPITPTPITPTPITPTPITSTPITSTPITPTPITPTPITPTPTPPGFIPRVYLPLLERN